VVKPCVAAQPGRGIALALSDRAACRAEIRRGLTWGWGGLGAYRSYLSAGKERVAMSRPWTRALVLALAQLLLAGCSVGSEPRSSGDGGAPADGGMPGGGRTDATSSGDASAPDAGSGASSDGSPDASSDEGALSEGAFTWDVLRVTETMTNADAYSPL